MKAKQNKVFYTELAYVIGIICTALGVALMEKADFGVSMVVAPAYVIYRKLSLVWPFFSFGMAEYMLQAVLLIVMWVVLKKVRISDCFSFVTAFIYGLILDACIALVRLMGAGNIVVRFILYLSGMLICSVGVSLVFHTYIAPEVYELFVKKISNKYGIETHRFKTIYDVISCLAGVLLSFLLFGFGRFIGVKTGTIVCALINGRIIGLCSRFFETHFTFVDRCDFRTFFSDKE